LFAYHLVINGDMHTDIICSHIRYFLCSLRYISNINQIYHQLGAILMSCSDAFLQCGITGHTEYANHLGTSFSCHFHFHCADIHGFHVCHHGFSQLREFLNHCYSLCFDERRSCFQPVSSSIHCFLGNLESPMCIDHIKGYLQYRFHSGFNSSHI